MATADIFAASTLQDCGIPLHVEVYQMLVLEVWHPSRTKDNTVHYIYVTLPVTGGEQDHAPVAIEYWNEGI